MIRHYEGKLGHCNEYNSFDYDDSIFKIVDNGELVCIYIGDGERKEPLKLPEGLTVCNSMFSGLIIKDPNFFAEFDTSKVVEMYRMFAGCTFPDGFKFGSKFNTSKVVDMIEMFNEAEFPMNFCLDGGFNTSSVEDMGGMFSSCSLPYGFSLGRNFDTSRVEEMNYMFSKCNFPEIFTLGNKFDTSNVSNMENMFYGAVRVGFSLGDKFDTSKVETMLGMFMECKFANGFSMGNKFDTSKVKDMMSMFMGCVFPTGGISLGDKFTINNSTEIEGMFSDCVIPIGFDFGKKFSSDCVSRQEYEEDLYNAFTYTTFECVPDTVDPDDAVDYMVAVNFNTGKLKNTNQGKDSSSKMFSTGSNGFDIENISTSATGKDTLKQEVRNYLKSGSTGNSILKVKEEFGDRLDFELASEISQELIEECKPIAKKSLESDVTVGDTLYSLCSKGYPKEVVALSIVEVLSNQYLCED